MRASDTGYNLESRSGKNFNMDNSIQSSNDNLGESLSNIFEKMVQQLDLITKNFCNFDNRLERMEKIVDEMNEEDLKNGIE